MTSKAGVVYTFNVFNYKLGNSRYCHLFPDIANSKEEAKLQQLNYDNFVNNLTDIVLRNTD